MSKKLEELYEDLEKYKNFDDGDNTEKFLYTLDQIVAFQNPSSIPIIIKYFDDDTDYGWVMQSLINAIESFADERYVVKVLENIQILLNSAEGWCVDLLFSLINNESCLKLFRDNIHLAPKESLLKLFDLMEKESPHHAAIIKELREELAKFST